jgi:hypothetical protein
LIVGRRGGGDRWVRVVVDFMGCRRASFSTFLWGVLRHNRQGNSKRRSTLGCSASSALAFRLHTILTPADNPNADPNPQHSTSFAPATTHTTPHLETPSRHHRLLDPNRDRSAWASAARRREVQICE